MSEEYYETKKYRCLMEHAPRLSQSLYLVSCGIERCTPDKSFGPVRRPGYHLHVILSGEGTLEVEGKATALHAGQMFLEKPGETTYYYPNRATPWSYCWVAFDGERAALYARESGFTDGVNAVNCYYDPKEFCRMADSILAKPELTLHGNLWRLGLLCQFLSLAVESHSHAHAQSARRRRDAEHGKDTYVDHAIDFIRTSYPSIKVADISGYIGIDRSYFTNLFKARVGCAPCDFLLYTRMDKAAQLLLNTELAVQDIAEYVGYENPLTFSKTFKKAFGVSPRYYREQTDEGRVTPEALARRLGIKGGSLL